MCRSLLSNTCGSMPSRSACDFTSVTAACALSFITSPSWPVSISLPLPRTRLDSTNRMSPPAGVQASPVATPGTLVRSATSLSKRGAPRMRARSSAPIATLRGLPRGDGHRGVAQHRADLALEAPHAGLARVVAMSRRSASSEISTCSGLQAVGLQLPLQQVALRDLRASRLRCSRVSSMISMRSRSGAGIVSSTLAVAMNSTFDRSKGTAR